MESFIEFGEEGLLNLAKVLELNSNDKMITLIPLNTVQLEVPSIQNAMYSALVRIIRRISRNLTTLKIHRLLEGRFSSQKLPHQSSALRKRSMLTRLQPTSPTMKVNLASSLENAELISLKKMP